MSNTAPASAVAISPRQTSMFSVLSVASAPLQPRNNENRSAYDVLPTPSAKRPMPLHEPQKYVSSSLRRFGTLRRSRILNSHYNLSTSPTGLPCTSQFRNNDEPSVEEPQAAKSSTYKHLSCHLDQRLTSLTIGMATDDTTAETADATTPQNGHQSHQNDGKFRHWANTFRRWTNTPPR
jgi:hypothetical protein